MRAAWVLVALAGTALWAGLTVAADAPLKPVTLPDDANKPLLLRACAVCHPIELVVQRKRPIEDWERQVARMVGFGAVATEAEQDRILDYLERWFSQAP